MTLIRIRFYLLGFVSMICSMTICYLGSELFTTIYFNATFWFLGYIVIPFGCMDNFCINYFLDSYVIRKKLFSNRRFVKWV